MADSNVILASDDEREQAARRLREHGASGRLNVEELTSRLESALTAKTRGEIDRLFADLPSGRPPRRSSGRRRGIRIHTQVYVLVCLGMIALWTATGMGYFWPVWPIFGWGIGVFSHRTSCRT